MTDYEAFLDARRHTDRHGFEPQWIPDWLFPFQRSLVEWSIQQGRAAIFADCGLGKTPMQLVWAENVHRETGRPVLILTPLAVSQQTETEAQKFNIEARRSKTATSAPITITNYEQLHNFESADYAGVVCDESSILKNFDGQRRADITRFMRQVPYRLLCTATAAPNDYTELGTSSEALGYLGHMDMLSKFFINQEHNATNRRTYGVAKSWRFKGHGEQRFWQWVCSWARAVRSPADLGYDDDRFVLPDLIQQEHEVDGAEDTFGRLFPKPAETLWEQRAERRATISQRCAKVADLVNDTNEPALVWCDLNDEGHELARLIPDAVQVAGADTDTAKEDRLIGFARGDFRVLVTKPKIGAWGLNYQHCAHVTFFPTHSYEQTYQGIRRCWRYGQTRPVTVDTITTPGSHNVLQNVRRKATEAARMFEALVAHMADAHGIGEETRFTAREEIPSWL